MTRSEMMSVEEVVDAWKKGCFEHRLAIEVRGYHCSACAAALLDGLQRLLKLRRKDVPSLWLDACTHGGAQGIAGCARCTAQVVKEVGRVRALSELSVPVEFPHERLGWKPG